MEKQENSFENDVNKNKKPPATQGASTARNLLLVVGYICIGLNFECSMSVDAVSFRFLSHSEKNQPLGT